MFLVLKINYLIEEGIWHDLSLVNSCSIFTSLFIYLQVLIFYDYQAINIIELLQNHFSCL